MAQAESSKFVVDAKGSGLGFLSVAPDAYLCYMATRLECSIHITFDAPCEADFCTVSVELHKGSLQNDCKEMLYVGFF